MEFLHDNYYYYYAISSALITLWVTFKVFNWVWLRPKRLEKILRQQGLIGSSYKFLFGDLKEFASMMKQAKSRPMSLSNDIVPRVLPHIQSSVQAYGKNSFTWFGTIPRISIMEPELVKEILTKNFIFKKPKTHPLVKLLATGLADYEDEQWTKHRKIINPAFHIEKLKHMLPAMYLSCNDMMSKWNTLLSSEDYSCEVDVWPHLETLSSDVISRTAFGSSYKEGQKIFQLQREQAELAIQAVSTLYIPGLRFLPTKRNNRMKEINKLVQTSLRGIIDKRTKAIDAGEAKNDDLLGILLESNLKEIKQHGNKKGVGLSIKEVIEECKLFYFAGQETTSVLLTWTMILLSWHQNWQQKAREEVVQIFGDRTPSFDGLNHLKVVTSILYEVMRLYPPLVAMSRTIEQDTKLGGLLLPSGMLVTLPTILIHQDCEIWGDDVKEFKPEKFLEGVSKATKNTISYFPFGWGPRFCIGQNFAMLEAKMALAMILQRFSFELSPSYSHAPYSMITLQPQYGAHLIMHKI